MTVLAGPRLILREITEADLPAVHAYSVRPEVARYQPWGPNTPEESRAFVDRAIAEAQTDPRAVYQLAITRVDGGQLIGSAGLTVHSVEHGQGEIGYLLHPEAWGSGYATEAARLLLGFGFDELQLHRIFATCDPRNEASVSVLKRLGLIYEGRLRETMRLRDGWRDSLCYSILAREWHQANGDSR
jgi:RimJ/RimL family protein N-acetyltransferase